MSRWVHGVILRSSLKSLILSLPTRAFCRTTPLYSHYDTLKVNNGATLKEIKDAYLKLTKQYHPDLHPNDPKSHDRFIELQEAYKVLSNPDTRRLYDAKFRNRPSAKYQRPYAYPDFTQRDEWIKQEQMRRETHFQQDFSRQNFNQYYSRPHKMSPEELEHFHKYQKFIRNDNFLYYLFGAALVGVFMEIMLVSHKQRTTLWADYEKTGVPPSFSIEEEYRRWDRQRPKTIDDEAFRVLSRERENQDSLSTNNWEEQNRSNGRREF